MNIRKITEIEIEIAAKKFTEIFYEYKAYDYFITPKNKFEKMYNMFLYEIFPTYKFTYTIEGYKGLCVMQKPGDEDLVDCYSVEFIRKIKTILSKQEIEKLKRYMDFAKDVSKQFFNKKEDCYVRNLGVVKDYRGQGIARKLIDELSQSRPIFLETHDKNNIEIYTNMGFEVVYEEPFEEDIIHYCLKRFAKKQ